MVDDDTTFDEVMEWHREAVPHCELLDFISMPLDGSDRLYCPACGWEVTW